MIRRAAAVLVTAFLLLGSAAQAHATGYRYWSFWDRDGDTWTYATVGPSLARPSDGDVQGFRFAVSQDSADAAQPRDTADFGTICADTPARDGSKRVALVIDFGTAADAPSGETPPAPRTACARVAPDATTAEALAAVAKPLRYDSNALLCAIAGYPQRGCGEQVSDSGSGKGDETGTSPAPTGSPAAADGDSDGGPSVGLVAGGVVVAVLAGAAVWQARRRRGHG
ncbi:SCO2322 family protein [Streptomyces sp. XM83C]|uniref:SCO2322 family protein n=1 Tax=Streptomyces thermocoprophilus TaxID=78356 RepID=A0ABV5VK33_9ACTN|nr:SCO2322 family protein [Streptomyces sp. XM83C]MCK1822756.1 SCO2322 family protein [Streptomyces sp. XM83C]